MKDEMKKYEKPSIEVMDIQWNECIATGSTTVQDLKLKLNTGNNYHTFVWGDLNNQGTWSDF